MDYLDNEINVGRGMMKTKKNEVNKELLEIEKQWKKKNERRLNNTHHDAMRMRPCGGLSLTTTCQSPIQI